MPLVVVLGTRRSPALLNLALFSPSFWMLKLFTLLERKSGYKYTRGVYFGRTVILGLILLSPALSGMVLSYFSSSGDGNPNLKCFFQQWEDKHSALQAQSDTKQGDHSPPSSSVSARVKTSIPDHETSPTPWLLFVSIEPAPPS